VEYCGLLSRVLWNSVEFCGILWTVLDCCGILWNFVEFCGLLWTVVDCCGILWNFVEFCGILWKSPKTFIDGNEENVRTQHLSKYCGR
jgi:hypothetical protein